jgi:predicted dehydrogenase
VGTEVPRRSYYYKELDFRISRSYGPGRYDPSYEDEGRDYPYAYVRWTEQRNMEAVVGLMAAGRLAVGPLISHRFTIDDAPQAYALITGKGGAPFLGVILTYSAAVEPARAVTVTPRLAGVPGGAGGAEGGPKAVRLGLIGAGAYASATLLPALKGVANLEPVGAASARGVTARVAAERFGFAYCTTDTRALLEDPAVNTVAILTRHNLHARQTIEALVAGKHVFVEKPLCLTEEELAAVEAAYNAAQLRTAAEGRSGPALMVGFNRRFAPMVVALKAQLARVREPLMLTCRVNAGFIPHDHWTQDPAVGGGRLLGEGCHFIDLLIFLVGERVSRVMTRALPDGGRYSRDNLLITLEFEGGSLGQIVYTANGDKGFGKEAIELFGGGLAARLDDYRSLSIRSGNTRIDQVARLRADKGHRAEWRALVDHITGKAPAPIAWADLLHSTRTTLAAQRSLAAGKPIEIA